MKVDDHRSWLELNARRFEEKWGQLPPPEQRYRRAQGGGRWHFCQNCSGLPTLEYEEAHALPEGDDECEQCASLRANGECAFY